MKANTKKAQDCVEVLDDAVRMAFSHIANNPHEARPRISDFETHIMFTNNGIVHQDLLKYVDLQLTFLLREGFDCFGYKQKGVISERYSAFVSHVDNSLYTLYIVTDKPAYCDANNIHLIIDYNVLGEKKELEIDYKVRNKLVFLDTGGTNGFSAIDTNWRRRITLLWFDINVPTLKIEDPVHAKVHNLVFVKTNENIFGYRPVRQGRYLM